MNKIHKNINNYYTNKINQHGATPKGVDWNGEESQFIRFNQLSKIIKEKEFSIADIGCGYGKYVDFLEDNYPNFNYVGYDLSDAMIRNGTNLYLCKENVSFKCIESIDSIQSSDYSIASGIFSVKMEHTESEWLSYILTTLEQMNLKSKKGFSFNMLTKYSDKEFMKENLYYADPLFIFDYCKRNFSKNISLNHDYGLYEFTILVRKDI
jgi:SAM-dependent methyltransferase